MLGISETTARVLIAEIGTDMSRFPAVDHLISWAGFCPRLDESAVKTCSTRTRQSAPWFNPRFKCRKGRQPQEGTATCGHNSFRSRAAAARRK
jgi:transposase